MEFGNWEALGFTIGIIILLQIATITILLIK